LIFVLSDLTASYSNHPTFCLPISMLLHQAHLKGKKAL